VSEVQLQRLKLSAEMANGKACEVPLEKSHGKSYIKECYQTGKVDSNTVHIISIIILTW
jgi:hypothetical protein